MSTSECSCRLWPTPGMYVVTSIPFVSRTRATFLNAEFGFFGVCVNTRTQTPRFCGLTCNAGLFVLVTMFLRPCRTSWLIVGIARTGENSPLLLLHQKNRDTAASRHSRRVVSGLEVGRDRPTVGPYAIWRLKLMTDRKS